MSWLFFSFFGESCTFQRLTKAFCCRMFGCNQRSLAENQKAIQTHNNRLQARLGPNILKLPIVELFATKFSLVLFKSCKRNIFLILKSFPCHNMKKVSNRKKRAKMKDFSHNCRMWFCEHMKSENLNMEQWHWFLSLCPTHDFEENREGATLAWFAAVFDEEEAFQTMTTIETCSCSTREDIFLEWKHLKS